MARYNIKIIALSLLLACALAAKFSYNNIRQGLTFDDDTNNFSPEFISSFRNFIKSGSAFFKNDTQKKLNYISDGLNKNYPVANKKYSVYQENQTSVQWKEKGYSVHNPNTIASLAKGVDLLNPQISYMVSLEHNFELTYIGEMGQGSGLTKIERYFIQKLILGLEEQSPQIPCASFVNDYLWNEWRQKWNYFYSDIANIYAVNAYVFDNKWIYFKTERCSYLMYLMYPGYE